jgi:hypothetical protein
MVDAQSAAAAVVGALLAVLGGIGTLAVLVLSLAGVMEWQSLTWLLPLALVVGAGLLTYGLVDLAGDLVDAVGGDGLEGVTGQFDAGALERLLD